MGRQSHGVANDEKSSLRGAMEGIRMDKHVGMCMVGSTWWYTWRGMPYG